MWNRRDAMIRLGQASIGALALPQLLELEQAAAAEKAFAGNPKAKSCILLYLWGGPPQQDMFDMKPNAPDGIRSIFEPISTSVPGIHMCDQLPRMSQHADKMAIIRSFTHDSDNHIPSVYYTLTGRKDPVLNNLRERNRYDFPCVGSVVASQTPPGSLPATVTVPRPVGHDGVTYSGTHAGFLGAKYDPLEMKPAGEVNKPATHDLGLPGGLEATRLQARYGLLKLLDEHDRAMQQNPSASVRLGSMPVTTKFGENGKSLGDFREQAFRMLTSPDAKRAFNLELESPKMRDRYGRNEYGESFLLSRRLVEAGVRLVTVVWVYIPPDGNVANVWDNHGGVGQLGNITGYETLLAPYCFPALDLAYSALMEDLQDRSMLDETLIVMMGEFGRTPKINKMAGRDHWGACQSVVLAGGGIRGGQTYGATDKYAGQVTDAPVAPNDMIATIYHAMGIPPHRTMYDGLNRPHVLSDGQPLTKLFG